MTQLTLCCFQQVNLVKSLDKEINPTQPKTAPNLPLVRESRGVTGHGILSSRQKSWTRGKQNEGYIENPVHYKLVSVFIL